MFNPIGRLNGQIGKFVCDLPKFIQAHHVQVFKEGKIVTNIYS